MTTKVKKYTELDAVNTWLNGTEEDMKSLGYYCFENNIATGDLIEQGLDMLCRARSIPLNISNLQMKMNEFKLTFEAQVKTLITIGRHEEIVKVAANYNQLHTAVKKLQKKLNGGF